MGLSEGERDDVFEAQATDDDRKMRRLWRVATETLSVAAADDQFDSLVDEPNLQQAMSDAYRQAKAQQAPEDDLDHLIAAAAAVMLIRQRHKVFCRGREPALSAQLGMLGDFGYVIAGALCLSVAILDDVGVDIPVDAQPRSRASLLSHLTGVDEQNVSTYPTYTAVDAIARCLREFKDQSSTPPPEPARQFSARQLLVAIGVTAVAVGLVAALAVALTGGEDEATTSTSPQASGAATPAPITLLPKNPPTVPLSQTLPNTVVQLFAYSDKAEPESTAETIPGLIPPVGGPVLAINNRLTFEVWLSIRDESKPPDTVSLAVNAVSPTVITEGQRLANRHHPQKPEAGLDNGSPVPVPTITDEPTIYRFVLAALPSTTTNGYWCGYTPKPVSILVTKGDSYESVITSYPVYVVRNELFAGKSC